MKLYASPFYRRTDTLRLNPGDIDTLEIEWAAVLNGATISASSWTTQIRGSVGALSLSNETSSGSLTTADVTSAGVASGIVTNSVTLSDGRELSRSFRVWVEYPAL